ncbi:hypothetical protein C8J29_10580 [Cereibacter johrii]|uniref:Uncharacterized protein n=1 Tax=Cereibacter johrii TaxID=445629 RepID=A0ABX5J7V7_9RHOB|nr:hypothetical protein C8J29_10580 [Cereibacter johrii]
MSSGWVERTGRPSSRGGGSARPGSLFAILVGATHSCGTLEGQHSRSRSASGGEDCRRGLANRRNVASPGRGSRDERSRSRDSRGSPIVRQRARRAGGLAQQQRQQDDAALGKRGCCGAPPRGGEPRRAQGAAPLSQSGGASEPRPNRDGSGAAAGSAACLFSSGGACGPRPDQDGSGVRAGSAARLPPSGGAYESCFNRDGIGAGAGSRRWPIRAGRSLPGAPRLSQHAAGPIRAQAEPAAAPRRLCQHVGQGPESAGPQGRDRWI